ncbi:MAG: hypothetical protein KDA42_06215 [Planctomycetales bacterium]|nr:hypothetical protein [Planctomycetales bacterium]
MDFSKQSTAVDDDRDRSLSSDELPLSLPIELIVTDAEVIRAACAHEEGGPRDRFLARALRVGVLALKHAVGEIDADRIRRESTEMLKSLDHRLVEHSRVVNDRVTEVLKRYFDPDGGQFQQRVERLIKRDGELEQLLSRHLGEQDSELCKTLSRHFGEESDLIKWLNPDKSRGLLAEMQRALQEQLREQRENVVKQFSLDNKEGALCRFLDELNERQGTLSKDLRMQIDDVVKQFSLDSEDSALSRLVNNVTKAERRITSEFSLDSEDSALARLRRELLKLHKDQQEASQKFQEEVKVTLKELAARRDEAAAGTRHGLDFEVELARQVEFEAQRTGDIATRTGATTGAIKLCKVGDIVVELGPENLAAGAKVVIEAKQKAGYTLAKAREEIEIGRKNRGAEVGLFVFSARLAPETAEPVVRHGDDVFVVWDPEDPQTDLFLRVGLTLARALCVRRKEQSAAEEADFSAIETAILEIEKQAERLGEIETWTKTIENNCGKIRQRLEASRKSLTRQIGRLNSHIDDLKSLVAE